MLSREHIAQIVLLATEGPSGAITGPHNAWYGPRWDGHDHEGRISHDARHYDRAAMVRMLAEECLASVHARYPDTIDHPEHTPGPIDHWYEKPYQYTRPLSHATAVEGLSLLACYEYQSCEHDGWLESEARSFATHSDARSFPTSLATMLHRGNGTCHDHASTLARSFLPLTVRPRCCRESVPS
jgi:hypothetical protein